MSQNANAVAVSAPLVARNFALRFPSDAPEVMVAAAVQAWNQRFSEHFEGAGHFSGDPEIEMYTGDDEKVVCCYAHYLYADDRLWAQIARSRTLTPDEPVLAVQEAYA